MQIECNGINDERLPLEKNTFQLLLTEHFLSSEPKSETYTKNDKEDSVIDPILDFDEREIHRIRNKMEFDTLVLNLTITQMYMISFGCVNPNELYLKDVFLR